MGLGMSLNLQKYLHINNLPPLHYSNRTLSKGDRLHDEGAIPEEKFEDVVRNSDVIFTMVGGAFVCYRMCAVLTKPIRSPMTMS